MSVAGTLDKLGCSGVEHRPRAVGGTTGGEDGLAEKVRFFFFFFLTWLKLKLTVDRAA